MDIFWVFIIIFGIVVSIGQKANKQQPTPAGDSEPTLTPEQEMERKIRELLEGKPAPSAKPVPSATPAPTAKSTPSSEATIATRTKTKREAHNAPSTTKSAKKATLSHKANATTKTSTAVENSPIKAKEIKRGEIGQIVEDFTIDKAVIYAEIMKPKYEEY